MPRLIRTFCLVVGALLLATYAHAATVTVVWNANAEPDITGYYVVYGTASGIYTSRLDAGNQTQLQIPNLVDGQTYYFAVQAYNSFGEWSDTSAEVSAHVGPAPLMSVDTPAHGGTVRGDFALSGWAIDRGAPTGTGVDTLHVWAFPVGGGTPEWMGSPAYGGGRGDVGAAYGAQFIPSSFYGVMRLKPGTWDLVVYARSTVTGTFSDARVLRLTSLPPQSNPLIVIDTPQAGAVNAPFLIAGWAADFAVAPGGAGPGIDTIHVWGYPDPGSGRPPVWFGVATMRGTRGDVAAAFGSQFLESGYGVVVSGVAPGFYRVVAYGRSTISGTFSTAASVDVTVR
jgi:hypothetical protein